MCFLCSRSVAPRCSVDCVIGMCTPVREFSSYVRVFASTKILSSRSTLAEGAKRPRLFEIQELLDCSLYENGE